MSYINAQSGNATTFTELIKVSDGTANIALQTNGSNVLVINNLQNPICVSTGAIRVPSGTDAQRPASPVNGMLRYNTSNHVFEAYVSSAWKKILEPTYTISYVSAAGGGGGGPNYGGGGGAGGYLTGSLTLTSNITYTMSVGAGGALNGGSGTSSNITGSTITTVNCVGGGGGGGGTATGSNGGSGGGGGGYGAGSGAFGGSGTAGQGNNGGQGATFNYSGGGGGGASGGGGQGSGGTGGGGGGGTASSITGSSVTYSAGARGGDNPGGVGGNGAANTGNGGAGGGASPPANGGAGGSGVVILSVPTARYTGATTGSPTVTTSGNNTILKYTTSGTYVA